MSPKKQTTTQAASEISQIVESPGSQKDSVDTRGEKVLRTSWTQDIEDMLVRTLMREIHMGK